MGNKLPDSYYINVVEENRKKGVYATYSREFLDNYKQALKNQIELLENLNKKR